MNDADLQAVRQLVIGAFRWVDGHADLSRVFRSADVLSVKGSHHPGASVHVQTAPDWRGRELLLRLPPDALRPPDRVLVVDDPPPPTRRRLNLHGLLRSAELPADVHG